MPNLIVIPTGYMGSGSSAVTDLVSELPGFEQNEGSFEYVFLHCPNGLFDLEDKLLRGNNALRSDEAVHAFRRCMERLYKRGYWFSDYQRRLSPDFPRFCGELIEQLRPVVMEDVSWYGQQNIDTLPKRVRNFAGRVASRLPVLKHSSLPGKPLDYRDVTMVFPSPYEFYAAARRFLQKCCAALGYGEHHLVLDQLLLPHNLFRLDHYFDENVRVFVVERDPRDVFLLNKYYWVPADTPVPYPTEVEAFCDYYERMRACERPAGDGRILRLRFEDLIYRYDETLGRIYDFLGADAVQHAAKKGTRFQPARSKNNTRLFRQPAYRAEAAVIEARLGRYLYDFPPAADAAWDEKSVF